MATVKTAAALEAGDAGRLVRLEWPHALGLDLTVYRLLEVRPENGIRATAATSVLLQNTGYCFEARQDKGAPHVLWLENRMTVHVLEAGQDSGDARDVTGCYCPSDCGCKRGRNSCGCTGKH